MKRHFPYYTTRLVSNARRLRKEMTDAEAKLWSGVRANQLGVKIRHQVPFDRYIVDFLCEEKRLIIELDGSQHFDSEGRKRDNERDAYLRARGYEVLRFDNWDMLQYPDEVVTEIVSYVHRDKNIESQIGR
ncbi:MAG TPA: DUF559 domain-containing protein [Bacteroidota bacterium]